MKDTVLGIQFDVNDLDAKYEVVGTSDNYSFQYNLGLGSDLVTEVGNIPKAWEDSAEFPE